ncbi:hypothetical protein CQW23_28516 [Capsicum baccatum]|uniref:G-patch domain-containing protein n=1 Tax=Capsicum baccatum TaxID=33114 RepID=A0A2G2VGV7_CAPBA|nr:hypothetical protein CQW23_28516 [Capsicum baccatum]
MERDDGSGCATSTSIPIDSSNLGFKLLKKHGWREGTGLGIAEQGRLEPVPAYIKKNMRGLGAEKPKKVAAHPKNTGHSSDKILKDGDKESKPKGISKKMKKVLELDKRMQEKEFERAFFREFWPDNV